MDILLTNYSLEGFGGTQVYTFALAEVLSKHHKVHVFSFKHGLVSEKVSRFATIVSNIRPNAVYDLILVNHRPCLEYVLRAEGPKIYTCHGPSHDLEDPKDLYNRADAIVGVSKEVQGALLKRGIQSTVIPNGVDCRRFHCSTPLRSKPNVLCLCKNLTATKLVRSACRRMGLEFNVVHYRWNPVWEVEDMINNSDIVVSLGRGAIEAMACGRNVVILDSRGYINKGSPCGDGMLLESNIEQSAKFNYSGRFRGTFFNVERLCSEFSLYDPARSSLYRRHALKMHNIEFIVRRYMQLARDISARKSA